MHCKQIAHLPQRLSQTADPQFARFICSIQIKFVIVNDHYLVGDTLNPFDDGRFVLRTWGN